MRGALALLPLALAIEQMHLSLSGIPGEMVVEFVTRDATPYACFWDAASPPAHPSPPLPPSPSVPGYLYGAGYLTAGDDLFSMEGSVPAAAAWCSANVSCAGFTFSSADPACGGAPCRILFKSAAYFAPGGGWQTYEKPAPPRPNATSTFFPYTNATLGSIGQMHTAVMAGLSPNTAYWYACGSGDDWSPARQFVSAPAREGGDVYAVFADFGRDNDESLVSLYAAAEGRDMDYVIHAGDFAYDFDSEGGAVGNDFMRNMEGYAARFPTMPACGNHESHFNYSQYQARFAGVAAHAGVNSGSGSAIYYSFDVGLVHWVALSTEVYWSQQGAAEAQLNWLRADLAKANANRAAVPWVVAFGHKSWYMDNNGACGGVSCTNGTWYDSLLHAAGVDLFFVGHMHEYRRLVPAHGTANATDLACISGAADTLQTYANCRYMATIVTGAAGNQEAQPPDCGGPAVHDPLQPTATCSRNYGFGFLTVANATHATWRWKTALPIAGSPNPAYEDTLQLVVEAHGPRAWV